MSKEDILKEHIKNTINFNLPVRITIQQTLPFAATSMSLKSAPNVTIDTNWDGELGEEIKKAIMNVLNQKEDE
tara:strand:- start:33 stop:251 length:219 start_codon:yes stop_codon:yes gene_type:complete